MHGAAERVGCRAAPRCRRAGGEGRSRFGLVFGETAQRARTVGPHVADPLPALPFVRSGAPLREGAALSVAQAKMLPLRNIIRDRCAFALCDVNPAAKIFGLPDLAVPAELKAAGISRIPLWRYCAQEAKERGRDRQAGVGGRVVDAVFDNLLERDACTYRHAPGFRPRSGFDRPGGVMAGIAASVEANPPPEA